MEFLDDQLQWTAGTSNTSAQIDDDFEALFGNIAHSHLPDPWPEQVGQGGQVDLNFQHQLQQSWPNFYSTNEFDSVFATEEEHGFNLAEHHNELTLPLDVSQLAAAPAGVVEDYSIPQDWLEFVQGDKAVAVDLERQHGDLSKPLDTPSIFHSYHCTIGTPPSLQTGWTSPAPSIGEPTTRENRSEVHSESLQDHKRKRSSPGRDAPWKRQPRITATTKQLLEERFLANPYPSAAEIDEVATLTQETAKRITNWFSNARARKQAPGEHENGLSRTRERLSPENLGILEATPPPDQQPPMSAFLTSPIENEPAELSAIEEALKSTDQKLEGGMPGPDAFQCSGAYAAYSNTVSHPSSRSRHSAMSLHSARSFTSVGSLHSTGSSMSRSRRRGRKRFQSHVTTNEDSSEENFYCTFCWKPFKNRYEWSRHKSSVHIGQESWVCCLSGTDENSPCPFCSVSKSTAAHLTHRRYLECSSKSEEDRTFRRKDHLIQHIKTFHINEKFSGSLNGYASTKKVQECATRWYRPVLPLKNNDPSLWCGFCACQFEDFESRSNHIAKHFTDNKINKSHWSQPALITSYSLEPKCHTCQGLQSWSCRNIMKNALDYDVCTLCEYSCLCENRSGMVDMRAHQYCHSLGMASSCGKEVFHNLHRYSDSLRDFKEHLLVYHNASSARMDEYSALLSAHFLGCDRHPELEPNLPLNTDVEEEVP